MTVITKAVDDITADAPEVTPASYRVYSGEGVRTELVCHVTGYPEPMVSWHYLHLGRQTEVRHQAGHLYSRQENIHRLTISSLSYREMTNFTCRAENEQGISQGDIEITGVPQPPRVISNTVSEQTDSYNLIFTVQSFQPLNQVKIKLWPKVSLKVSA